jgi:putative exporter of polyketide antibiotics
MLVARVAGLAVLGTVFGGLAEGVGGALVQLPAVWALAAITVAAFGLLPHLTAAGGWGALAVFLLLGQFGALTGMSQRDRRASHARSHAAAHTGTGVWGGGGAVGCRVQRWMWWYVGGAHVI